jgi:hypothetical protein
MCTVYSHSLDSNAEYDKNQGRSRSFGNVREQKAISTLIITLKGRRRNVNVRDNAEEGQEAMTTLAIMRKRAKKQWQRL